jgi:Ca-activated chloride channel family protein
VPIGMGGNSPVWISIDRAITELSNLDGRRVVLIFSDGRDEPVPTLMPVKLKDVMERARLTNIMVYALGFADVQRRPGKDPKIVPPDSGLRRLADDSGGGYFEIRDTEKLGEVFTRVAEELHRQYWLGFAPPARDGKVHKIAVKVKRPELTVRARQSYVAPPSR